MDGLVPSAIAFAEASGGGTKQNHVEVIVQFRAAKSAWTQCCDSKNAIPDTTSRRMAAWESKGARRGEADGASGGSENSQSPGFGTSEQSAYVSRTGRCDVTP